MARGKQRLQTQCQGAARREPDRSGHILGLSRSGFHEMAYVEWGPAEAEQRRHLRPRPDAAGPRLRPGKRACSAGTAGDLPGPGRPGTERWLRDPADYTVLQYCADMNALIARTGASRRLGRHLPRPDRDRAGRPSRQSHPAPRHQRHRPGGADQRLQRIGRYVAEMPETFATFDDAERYLREVLAPFGDVADEHWRHLTRTASEGIEQGVT